jgi:hypothetical protein
VAEALRSRHLGCRAELRRIVGWGWVAQRAPSRAVALTGGYRHTRGGAHTFGDTAEVLVTVPGSDPNLA